ncbi:pyridoxamine 5'-phosphate oxidase family protein [Streptomyces sp. NPDC053048]|uniref:pyridoxamine 5'-phosphate oxidase family protein n=1 Tax=Streptomyces sp. NPDC053048 TaxID=3365694 RepID=UPI0037D0589E
MTRFARIAYTEAVLRAQEENGSAAVGLRTLLHGGGDGPDPLGPDEAAFITARDGFYMATVGETGWPYMQYRGGPPGFLRVVDRHTLAFADVRGNRQYITVGNLSGNDRVALFFMDYAHRTRLKVYGHASVRGVEEEPALAALLAEQGTDGRVERLVVIKVEGMNWNCPQHITPRYTEQELGEALAPVREHILRLEEENERLRALLADRENTP